MSSVPAAGHCEVILGTPDYAAEFLNFCFDLVVFRLTTFSKPHTLQKLMTIQNVLASSFFRRLVSGATQAAPVCMKCMATQHTLLK